MLSAEEQERFSRHLLLDGFGGGGQERAVAGTVEIELPALFAAAGRSCARALAAAGVGRLVLRGPWAGEAAAECRHLAPRAEIVSDPHEAAEAAAGVVRIVCEAERTSGADEVAIAPADTLAELAGAGALAACAALLRLAGGETAGLDASPLALFPARARS